MFAETPISQDDNHFDSAESDDEDPGQNGDRYPSPSIQDFKNVFAENHVVQEDEPSNGAESDDEDRGRNSSGGGVVCMAPRKTFFCTHM